MKVSKDERNLMMIYNPGSRFGLIEALLQMKKQLTPSETELGNLTDSVLAKLEELSDEEFEQLELYPD